MCQRYQRHKENRKLYFGLRIGKPTVSFNLVTPIYAYHILRSFIYFMYIKQQNNYVISEIFKNLTFYIFPVGWFDILSISVRKSGKVWVVMVVIFQRKFPVTLGMTPFHYSSHYWYLQSILKVRDNNILVLRRR